MDSNEHIVEQGVSYVDSITPKILLVLVFLLPFFFIPTPMFGIIFGKTALLVFGVMLALIAWGVNVLRRAIVRIPHPWTLTFISLVPITYFISALLSPATRTSLIGHNIPLESVFVVASLYLFGLLVVATTVSRKQFLHYYGALGLSLLVIAAVHIARLIGGPEFLSFSVLTSPTSSFLGKWNDIAIFFGFGAVLPLIILATLAVKRNIKILLYIILIVSWFFMVIVNFTPVWYMTGIIALLFLVYLLSQRNQSQQTEEQISSSQRYIIVPLVITLLLAGIFIGSNLSVSGFLNNSLGLNHLEVRPSLQATLDVTQNTLKESPLFGVGPNRFSSEWLLHKPEGINETAFWQVEFNNGIGIIPSAIVNVGLVGLASLLLLMGFILYNGVDVLVRRATNNDNRLLVLSSFIGALYFWTFAVIYTPSTVIQMLTLLFTGLFFASLYISNHERPIEIQLSSRPTINFLATLTLLIIIFVGASGAYTVTERIRVNVLYQRGLEALGQGNIDESQNLLLRATRLFPNDVYHRTLSQSYLLGINTILRDQETPQDLLLNQFQVQLGNAIAAARRAIDIDGTNYANWLVLGNIYNAVTPLNIQGAYEEAATAYAAAAERNPGPDVFLNQARLEAARGNNEEARVFIGKTLDTKSNYIDAVFLLAQIQLAEGNVTEAIRSIEIATLASPRNPIVFFQLGLLKYGAADYQGAVTALETAISLSPVYANAKYFLGLSYSQTGKREQAIQQFEGVAETNSDNQEVKLILENLRADKPPLAGAQPPLDTPPEDREELPLEENLEE